MDTVIQDLRYALRSLAHRPGFTSLAIVMLRIDPLVALRME